MSKVDDLTILLKMVDKTKPAFTSISQRLGKLGKIAGPIGTAFKALGTILVGAFVAATANGKVLFDELNRMSNSINTTTQEADELYKIIREGAPATNLENLGEGLLTLKEGFFDAAAESGPLFDLIKDFGADIDLSLESPRDQLLEFLKAMREIPSTTIRAGAAVANFGGEDAKSIIKITNDTQTLNDTIARLEGTLNDIPDFISQIQLQNMEDAKNASNQLNNAWDSLSVSAYSLVSPALEFISNKLTTLTKWADSATRSFGKMIGVFDIEDLKLPSTIAEANEQLDLYSEKIAKASLQRQAIIEKSKKANKNAGIESLFSINNFGNSSSTSSTEAIDAEIEMLFKANQKIFDARKDIISKNEAAQKIITDAKEKRKREQAAIAARQLAITEYKSYTKQRDAMNQSAAGKLIDIDFQGIDQLSALRESIPQIERHELLRIMGLDFSEQRKSELGDLAVQNFMDMEDSIARRIQEIRRSEQFYSPMDSFDAVAVAGQEAANDDASGLREAATDAQNLQSALSAASSAVDGLSNAFGKSKTNARAFVAIQQTLALVSAYAAATQALAEAKGDPVLRFAAYASVLAQGLAGYTAIKNASSSGGLGSGGSGSADAAAPSQRRIAQAPAPATQQQQVVNITIPSSGDDAKIDVSALNDALKKASKVPGSPLYNVRQVAA